jgi:hypothetical protein
VSTGEESLPAFLDLPQIHIDAQPAVYLHSSKAYPPMAIVQLAGRTQIFMRTSVQARAIAAAFTEAAELLEKAAAEQLLDDKAEAPAP